MSRKSSRGNSNDQPGAPILMTTNFTQRWIHPIRVIAAALLPGMAVFPSSAQQLPTGGSVAAGKGSVGAAPHGTPHINSKTNPANINLDTISGGARRDPHFHQPGRRPADVGSR